MKWIEGVPPRDDGLPTQGEQAEEALQAMRCTCGQPMAPGIMHRTDGPCYYVEPADEPLGGDIL